MNISPTLGLKLPSDSDYFNISDFNYNFTKIEDFVTDLGLSIQTVNAALQTTLQGGGLTNDST